MEKLEAPPGFEPGIEVLQTSALPLGDGAGRNCVEGDSGRVLDAATTPLDVARSALSVSRTAARGTAGRNHHRLGAKVGAGNGIRTRDFDLGKVALYH